MKLSEAILLGSTMIRPAAGQYIRLGGTHGCALGMGLAAIGKASLKDDTPLNPLEHWRWLAEGSYLFPCVCSAFCNAKIDAHAITIHLFDDHLCGSHDLYIHDRWTIERIAEWVASVEPQEEAASQQAESTEAVAV